MHDAAYGGWSKRPFQRKVGIEFQDVVRKRRMVRDFEDRALPSGVLDRLLRASLRGPSAAFAQGFELLVLEGAQTTRFWDASLAVDASRERWAGIMNAPALVVFFAHEKTYRDRFGEPDKTRGIDLPWWYIDTAYAAMIMLLAAVDARLGASFFSVNDPDGVRREFHIPDEFVPIGAIAIGHPRDDRPSKSASRRRRPFDEVVHRGNW